jgi:hypothetical protein
MAERIRRWGAEKKIKFFLSEAAKAIVRANRSTDPDVKSALLRVAQCWIDIACEAEPEDAIKQAR